LRRWATHPWRYRFATGNPGPDLLSGRRPASQSGALRRWATHPWRYRFATGNPLPGGTGSPREPWPGRDVRL
jgi:hypothetical protein